MERFNKLSSVFLESDVVLKIQETSKIGTWEVDLVKQIVYWDKITKQIHEVDENYLPNLQEGINFYPEGIHRERITELVDRAVQYGESYDEELQILTSTGKRKWVRVVGMSEYKEDECIRLYGLFQDISQQVKNRQDIEEQRELFSKTFDFAPNGMALVGLDGNWIRVNQKISDMLGYSADELKTMTFQDITHSEDLNADLNLLNEVIEGKIDTYQLEKRYIHKKGYIVWALLAVSVVKDSKGTIKHFISQLTDITAEKRLLTHTEEQNQRLLNFAHIVSHNLRSHTSNFTMLLSLLEMENPLLKEQECFDMLILSASKFEETLKHLNEVVAMRDEVASNLHALNLCEYIDKTQQTVQFELDKYNTIFINEIDTTVHVQAVPAYLESILLNFITNAIKYRSFDRTPSIQLSMFEKDEYTVLQIADNGIGIDLEKHGKKLFGMYKTFHDRPNAHGIGLFITRNQVEAMGGYIEVESQVDIGTTFTIFFKNGNN